ncbi:MAG: hypothetical protein ACE145_21610 [Terriglobia bacterium]
MPGNTMSRSRTLGGFGADGMCVACKDESASPAEEDDEFQRGSGREARSWELAARPIVCAAGISLGLLLTLVSSGFSADPPVAREKRGLGIRVLVYNYSEARPSTLKRAEDEARRILSKTGIKAVWITCPMLNAEAEKNPVCRLRLRATDLVVRLHPKFRPIHPSFERHTVGFVPRTLGDPACYASVFYDRIMTLAETREFTPGMILGHALAHEIGHVLLGPDSHSDSGIMCPNWDRSFLEKAVRGQLLFTPIQAESIRADVRARIDAQEGLDRAPLAARPGAIGIEPLTTDRNGAGSSEYRRKAARILSGETPHALSKEAQRVTYHGQ